MTTQPELILASTSRYRRSLLDRLGLPFEQLNPGVDEAPAGGEAPGQLASRLAEAKALAVAAPRPGAWVIGSDQVAELDGEPMGKPGAHEPAVAQLGRCSGRTLVFHTAVCLAHVESGYRNAHTDVTRVRFRKLTTAEIESYLLRDQPYDCAGSIKIESLGVTLLESVESTDPTALMGLPLIWLARTLTGAGFKLL